MYAICEVKGKQYKFEVGKEYRVDLLNEEKDSKLEFNSVLLLKDTDGNVKVGKPFVDSSKVEATVVDPFFKGEKVVSFKYKRRKGYRRKVGHRQKYSIIKIESIA